MRRRTARAWQLTRALLLLLGFAVFEDAGATDEHFDCVDAFDLIVLAITIPCQANTTGTPAPALLIEARDKLIRAGFYTAADFDELDVRWCPLTNALGFTRDAQHILLASGLALGSADLVAEVLAHEMVHVRQFRQRGADGFRCDYVNAFIACAACQDRGHTLEAEAYALQDQVRVRLHTDWLNQ
jgi:hypothetical protein